MLRKLSTLQIALIISAFDSAYSAYNGFQSGIERYWTLLSLAQTGTTELDAVVMKDGLVRVDSLPLVLRALGAESIARGTHVRLRITGTDLLTLDVHANVVARLDDVALDAAPADAEADELADSAGPLTLAIDVAGDSADTDAAQTADAAPGT